MPLADDSLVTPVSRDRCSATIAPGWDIVGNANGGYLPEMHGPHLKPRKDVYQR
jgi:hypothetical protein